MPLDYDPLLSKLAVWAGSREEAVARMIRALDEYHVVGIKTNLAFFRQLMEDEQIRRGELHTGLVDEFLNGRPAPIDDPELQAIAALVGLLKTTLKALLTWAELPVKSAVISSPRTRSWHWMRIGLTSPSVKQVAS